MNDVYVATPYSSAALNKKINVFFSHLQIHIFEKKPINNKFMLVKFLAKSYLFYFFKDLNVFFSRFTRPEKIVGTF